MFVFSIPFKKVEPRFHDRTLWLHLTAMTIHETYCQSFWSSQLLWFFSHLLMNSSFETSPTFVSSARHSRNPVDKHRSLVRNSWPCCNVIFKSVLGSCEFGHGRLDNTEGLARRCWEQTVWQTSTTNVVMWLSVLWHILSLLCLANYQMQSLIKKFKFTTIKACSKIKLFSTCELKENLLMGICTPLLKSPLPSDLMRNPSPGFAGVLPFLTFTSKAVMRPESKRNWEIAACFSVLSDKISIHNLLY